MSLRAFVSGSNGFLGVNLVKALLDDGWDVTALHRKTSDLRLLNGMNVHLVEGDICSTPSLQAVMPDNLKAVFHCAADTSFWHKHAKRQYDVNVNGTSNMLQVAKEKKADCFIHSSSVSAFGYHPGVISESTGSNAINSGVSYNRTKFLAEQQAIKSSQNGQRVIILNPCHMLGRFNAKNWADMVSMAYQEYLHEIPEGIGSFCLASDVARACIAAVQDGKNGERYLLGGPVTTMLEFINKVQQMYGKRLTTRTTSKAKLWLANILMKTFGTFSSSEPRMTPEKLKQITQTLKVDDRKAVQQLSYQHSSLEDMIKETVEWMIQEKNLAS